MNFSSDNPIIRLCATGMEKEGEGKNNEAALLFSQAWNDAVSDFEKFIAAHYVARHQPDIAAKLKWDETALVFALKANDETSKESLPSLYLNIGKCHEGLGNHDAAGKNYEMALSFANLLPEDGYGKMIRSGILNGLRRVAKDSSVL